MTTDDEHLLPRPRPHLDDLPAGPSQPAESAPRSPGTQPPDASSAAPRDEPWRSFVDRGVHPQDVGRTLENAQDALALMLGLVGRESSGPPALWFVVLSADDGVLPVVLPIPEVPTIADPVVAANLVHVLTSVVEHDAPGGSLLVTYVRRGGGDLGAFESGWSAVLREAALRAGVRIRAELAVGRDRARVLAPRW